MTAHAQNLHGDHWSVAASKYASTVGRSSAEAGTIVVDMANTLNPISSSSKVLDVGTGTGAVALAVASLSPDTPILAADNSQGMLELVKSITATSNSKIMTTTLDANKITETYAPSSFTHIFSNFVLQTATEDPVSMVRQMHEVLEPDGIVGLGVWGPSPDPYKIFDRACRSINPDFVQPPPFEDQTAWRTPGELAAGMQKAGFKNIKTTFRRIPFVFGSGEEFAQFWFGAKNPGAQIMINKWNDERVKAGQDPAAVREVLVRIVDEEWNKGQDICVEVVLGVGQKA